MLALKIDEFYIKNFINFLICLLPVSFIAGNLIINLNLGLIIIFSFLFYGKEIFKLKLLFFDKVLILIFIFAIFTSLFNTFNYKNDYQKTLDTFTINKTLSFLRFLFFYFAMRFLVEKKIFSFKYFFVVSSLCSIFVSLDLIYQFINGKDIFGFTSETYKLAGPFGDEQIAGSYLQRFSVFSFFLIIIYYPNLSFKTKLTLFLFLILLFFYSIFLAGNRMPIIVFMLFWIFLFFLEKRLRNFSILFLGSLLFFFYLVFQFNDLVNTYTLHFFRISNEIVKFVPVLLSEENINQFPNTYVKEFYSGLMSWKENFYIGGGINSFHYNCVKSVSACASHPHNYYLEILSEHGLIGMLLWSIVFLYVVFVSIIKKYFLEANFINNHLITPFAILFLVEIFPFKTTGSFFTTGNATFIFLILSVIIALSRKSQYN